VTRVPALSIVIPVRNDAARLGRCLASIAANGRPAEDVEVIVLDNGSSDGSAGVARSAGAQVLYRPDVSVAAVRNAGAAEARGVLFAFIDADHEIDRHWIASALDVFRDAAVGAAGAPYDSPADANWVQRVYDGLRHRASSMQSDVDWLPSGNLVVTRAAFAAIGGFDTTLATCEDVDFCRRLRAAGYRIVSDRRLRSVHLGDPASLRAVFAGELWRGRDNLKASLRPPIRYRELPSIVIPVLDLVFLCLFLCVGVLAVISGSAKGLMLAGAALAAFVALAVVRTFVIVGRLAHAGPLATAQTFMLAIVYDAARALAIVAHPSHAVRRRG
jgi:glycosyltransferase involved in cell wall biosynthesis